MDQQNSKMEPAIKLGLLKDEYLKLHDFYEDVDNRSLTIKGFSITVSTALAGAALAYKESYFWLLAAVAAGVFWYLDAFWRTFQYPFSKSIKDIERSMRDGTWNDLAPLQIYAHWSEVMKGEKLRVSRTIRKAETMFPHAAVLIISLLIYASVRSQMAQ